MRLAAGLRDHADVEFACGACPHVDQENRVATAAKEAGLPLVSGLRLRKHFDPWNSGRDYKKLRERIDSAGYDLVHSHLLNDHLLLGAAARRSKRRPRILRTVYGGPDLSARVRSALAFSRLIDGVICATDDAAAEVKRRTSLPHDRIETIEGAVDVDRFAPERLSPLRESSRAELGCGPDSIVFGIVARVQRHRKYDLLFESFSRAVRQDPRLKLVVVGRGTYFDEVALEPVSRLGIADHVRFPGYREGREYEALLAAFDVGLFLVPGSDASCRAARELAAAGLPLLVTRRPALLEIVDHGARGVAVAEEPAEFAAAMLALAGDPDRRAKLATISRANALERFSLRRQVDRVAAFYSRILEAEPWSARS